jgi:competence protein ComEC
MWKYIFILLILCNISLWFVIGAYPDDKLHVIACDVGQGDGILIYRGRSQIIIDGGAGNKMTKCLDRHLPFWDRSIEVVMNTHPQLDHYEGLIEVFKRYNVQYFTANSLNASASEYRVLKDEVRSKGVKVLNPTRGMAIVLDDIRVDILHPSVQFLAENTQSVSKIASVEPGGLAEVLGSYTSTLDPNEFSIQAMLHYKNFDALFTGDAGEMVEDVMSIDGTLSDIEYLKVPHHGSKNGLTEDLLTKTTPETAVISNGKKNSYGHPHKQVLDMLENSGIKTYRTDQMGDVEVVSDGERYWIEE